MIKLTSPYAYTELERTMLEHGRHYIINGESKPLPSVTTILSNTEDKLFLEEWKQRVGKEEADRVVEAATRIGNGLHDNLENYMLKGQEPTGNYLTKVLTNMVIKKGLCKVSEIWGCEIPLYNPGLYAGTTDLISVFNGVPSVVDFKNSSKDKKKEYIESYFLQIVAYALAHNEMHGTNIKQGVVMIACHSGKYMEYVISGLEFDRYAILWAQRVEMFYNIYGL